MLIARFSNIPKTPSLFVGYKFMRHLKLHAFILIVTILIGCNTSNETSKVPLIKKDTTKKLERENTLIAFVCEKIDLKQLPHEEGSLDNGFLATYKILQRVYSDYPSDTITFRVYDHYGIPAFSKFKNVLLYVSKAGSFYYHEKYQYNDVYKTKDGRWAGSYTYDYDNQIDSSIKIKPQIIPFENEVFYTINKNDADYNIDYPEPYFKIEGQRAKVVYGNYVEDLLRLKKNGILSYRGLFGDTIPIIKQVEIQDVQLESIEN